MKKLIKDEFLEKGELVELLESEKIDYEARIYRVDGKYVVVTKWLDERSILGVFDTLEEAVEEAKEAIEIQEHVVAEEN